MEDEFLYHIRSRTLNVIGKSLPPTTSFSMTISDADADDVAVAAAVDIIHLRGKMGICCLSSPIRYFASCVCPRSFLEWPEKARKKYMNNAWNVYSNKFHSMCLISIEIS